jgi:hypothetical protein
VGNDPLGGFVGDDLLAAVSALPPSDPGGDDSGGSGDGRRRPRTPPPPETAPRAKNTEKLAADKDLELLNKMFGL